MNDQRLRLKRAASAAALAVSLSAAPALAQDWTFADLDADGNLELAEREFEQVTRDFFQDIDADRDDLLTEEELRAASDRLVLDGDLEFTEWDNDADGVADWREFHTELFETFDIDADDVLSEQELAALEQSNAPTGG